MINRQHRLMLKRALLPRVSFQEILQVKIKKTSFTVTNLILFNI